MTSRSRFGFRGRRCMMSLSAFSYASDTDGNWPGVERPGVKRLPGPLSPLSGVPLLPAGTRPVVATQPHLPGQPGSSWSISIRTSASISTIARSSFSLSLSPFLSVSSSSLRLSVFSLGYSGLGLSLSFTLCLCPCRWSLSP